MENQKLENLGNLENLRNINPSFLISEFSILQKLRLKKTQKKIFPRSPRFFKFPSFQPGFNRRNNVTKSINL